MIIMNNNNTNNKNVSRYSAIVDIFLSAAPSIVFSIIFPYYGEKWGLISNKIITPFGIAVCIIYVILLAVIIIFYNIISHKNDGTISEYELNNLKNERNVYNANYRILSNVLENSDDVCNSKLKTLKSEIKKYHNNPQNIYPTIISNPQKQLDEILRKLFDCVAEIIKMPKHSINYDVAIKIEDSDWDWLNGFEPSEGVPIGEVNVEGSLFRKLVTSTDKHTSLLFYNKKSFAISKGYYKVLSIDRDESGNFIDGSILAKHIFVGESYNDKWIELAIFISTQNNDFFIKDNVLVNESDGISNAKKNLREHIFSHFDLRLQIELSLLLLDSFNSLNDSNGNIENNQTTDNEILSSEL